MKITIQIVAILMVALLPMGVMGQDVSYNGNGNTGFGGTIGAAILNLSDDGTTVSGELTRGTGNMNDALVIYIDSKSGGFSSTAGFTDQADGLRKAISSIDGANRTTVNFPTGFQADYAIALGPSGANFGGIWELVNGGSHTFVSTVNLSPTSSNNAATYTFDFDFSEVGYATGLKFVATYTSLTAFMSDETFGASSVSGNPGSNGTLTFTNYHLYRALVQLTGSAGWRLLSSPKSGATFNNLLGPIWTQGALNADATSGTPNVFSSEGSTNLSLVQTNVTNLEFTMTSGTGYAVYVYEDDDYATAGVQGGFPKTLTLTGEENGGDANFAPTWTSGTQYGIAGNPFATTIDWDNVTKSADVSNSVWVWNPATSTYDAYNTGNGNLTDGLIAPFQGFWMEYDGAASDITFPNSAKTEGGTFRGKEQVRNRMVVRATDSAGSNQAWISFRDEASFGQDSFDAVKLTPLSSNYIQLYSVVNEKAHDINSLPIGLTDVLEIPLGYSSTRGGSATLDLTELNLPSGWMVSIRDNVTGVTQAMGDGFTYTFETVRAKASAEPKSHVLAASSPRFTLIIDPLNTTSTKDDGRGTMDVFALLQNYPNPFNPSTQIRFTLQSSDVTRLTVYDILGREITVLVNGVMPAGAHTATFDASNLTSGVYIYKLEAGGQVMTKRMTLIK